MNFLKKVLLFIITVVVIIAMYYLFNPEPEPEVQEATPFHVYLHGSYGNNHDVLITELVDSDTSIGLYCSDPSLLNDAVLGDVAISGRANSYLSCYYVNSELKTYYPVIGGGNYDEFVGDVPNPDAIFVTNQYAYGHAVEYMLFDLEFGDGTFPISNLGDAFAFMANTLTAINEARLNAGLSVLSLAEIKHILNESSDGVHEIDGKYYGLILNTERAIDYAVNGIPQPPPPPPAEPCVGAECAFLVGAVYYLLLLSDDDTPEEINNTVSNYMNSVPIE